MERHAHKSREYIRQKEQNSMTNKNMEEKVLTNDCEMNF